MRVAMLGFGLIGGSIARALPADWEIAAWSPSGSGVRRAGEEGIVRAASRPAEAVEGADLVVLAAPPLACLDLLDSLAGELGSALRPDATVTDVASTKVAIANRARGHGIRFVGGHPMAGRESSGYEASDPGLFRDRPWVIVGGGAAAEDVERAERLATATGARPVHMEADAHDAAVAAISHLPLLTSVALVEAVAGRPGAPPNPDWPAVLELAATGWRDATRLARGDAGMGAGIAVTNAGPLAARVRAVRDALDEWLAELDGDASPDPDRLAARFASARKRLESPPG
jgi:prephenate dehydrogenase